MDSLPFVTALLVTRNEFGSIQKALQSYLNQTYPKSCFEIIVIDGISTDGTREYVQSQIEEYANSEISIKLLDNPKKSLAAGWNIGIKIAKGQYVIRIDAHAEASPTMIETSVSTIEKDVNAVCVGGKLISLSIDGSDNVISKVLSSPFGVGNSSFRVSSEPRYTDTAVYGLYKKSVFDEIGYFDENLLRNQDIELHNRISKSGYKFYYNPEIESIYYTRNTFKKMLKQAYGNGFWNMMILNKGGSGVSLRHLVPFAFVLFLIATIICGFFFKPIWYLGMAFIVLHLLLGIVFAILKTHELKEVLLMPWLFMLLHISYGTGYLAAIFKRNSNSH
ncbi:MAG TPA: glycosyltransferase family 2 protein [Saprospiraceae bacterium]|nr:glycosyltransferase family 2 protein [Saprospiraceae bacterium]